MEKNTLKIMMGFFAVMLIASSSLLIVSASTGTSPLEILFPVSEQQAISIAQYAVTGSVQEVETATTDNPVYEVEIVDGDTETEVLVDAHSGDVLMVKAEDEAEDVPITGTALEKASAAALAHIGEGRVTDTEVGDEEGFYEIEITKDNGREVDVHLDENFNVLSVEY